MGQELKIRILSSKKLSKSFNEIEDKNIWESMTLTLEQTQEVVKHALSKLTITSEPLTLTFTVGT